MWPEVLLHLLPFQHSEASDPLLVLALVFAGVLAAAFVGIAIANRATASPGWGKLATGFGLGALLFLLFDLLKESASLGQGLVRAPLLQVGLLLAFALGALAIPWAWKQGSSLRLAWLWTLGIAAHGAGEGWIVGTEAAGLEVGSALGMTSFLLHKAIEGFTVPLVAAMALPARHGAAMAGAVATATLLAGLAGLALGGGPTPLFLFAAGAGAASFAILRLGGLATASRSQAAAVTLGLVAVYAAGLLHELG